MGQGCNTDSGLGPTRRWKAEPGCCQRGRFGISVKKRSRKREEFWVRTSHGGSGATSGWAGWGWWQEMDVRGDGEPVAGSKAGSNVISLKARPATHWYIAACERNLKYYQNSSRFWTELFRHVAFINKSQTDKWTIINLIRVTAVVGITDCYSKQFFPSPERNPFVHLLLTPPC